MTTMVNDSRSEVPRAVAAPWFLEWAIARQQRKLGESLNYLREIASMSLSAFFKFAMFVPMAEHRRVAGPDAYAVARLVAVRHEDCGPCLQTTVNLSLQDGADLGVVRAVLARDVEALPPDLACVYAFAHAVVTGSEEAGPLALRVERALGGRAALVDLALGIAGARVFPTVRRALGHAISCSRVLVTAGGQNER